MIKITVNKTKKPQKLIHRSSIFNTEHGTVFQQYFRGKPKNWFYISCGYAEDSVVTIWYDNEACCYKLSVDNRESISQLVETVKVVAIEATVEINLLT